MRSASDNTVVPLARGPRDPPARDRRIRRWWRSLSGETYGRALRDAILLSLAGALLIVLSVTSGAVAALYRLAGARPSWHLEQWLPATAVVAGACLAIYAFRRAADARSRYGNVTTDPLTGVLNRRGFMDRLHTEIAVANRYGQPVSVLAFDLDQFRRLNDAHGLEAGDKLLREVADVVSFHLREADVLARWGGGEFRVLCTHTDLGGARVVAERLRGAIENRFRAVDHSVTASFGIAERALEESAQQLLARADRRMYHAKITGRNRLVG